MGYFRDDFDLSYSTVKRSLTVATKLQTYYLYERSLVISPCYLKTINISSMLFAMIEIVTKSYKCEICEKIYDTQAHAQFCESIPKKSLGFKIGQKFHCLFDGHIYILSWFSYFQPYNNTIYNLNGNLKFSSIYAAPGIAFNWDTDLVHLEYLHCLPDLGNPHKDGLLFSHFGVGKVFNPV